MNTAFKLIQYQKNHTFDEVLRKFYDQVEEVQHFYQFSRSEYVFKDGSVVYLNGEMFTKTKSML